MRPDKCPIRSTLLALVLLAAASISRADVVVVNMGAFGSGVSGGSVPLISGVEVRVVSGSFAPPVIDPPIFPANTALFQGTTSSLGEEHVVVSADSVSASNFDIFTDFISGPNAWLAFQYRVILADGTAPAIWDVVNGESGLNLGASGYDLLGWEIQEVQLAFTSRISSTSSGYSVYFPQLSISFVGAPASPVPEPSSLSLVLVGFILVAAIARSRTNSTLDPAPVAEKPAARRSPQPQAAT